MSNVEIIVEDRPGPETGDLEPNGPNGNEDLLGLYLGVPLTERGEGYFGVLPDRIILYRRNIEAEATSRSDLTEIVRRTVIHEIAHHFGIDDERLEELGWD